MNNKNNGSNGNGYQLAYLKNDLISSIVVFLVAIPLCLGIALASGAPLFSGIIAGIIGGIIVGSISQSPVSVSGPAAGMIAIVLTAISQLGSFEAFLLALLFAGLIQIITGSLKAGFVADYVPSNVIQGLLCAIGILIIFKQLPLAFTHAGGSQYLISTLKESAQDLDFKSLIDLRSQINLGAIIITIASLFTLIYFDFSKISFIKKIPGPIVVVIAGIIINELFKMLNLGFLQDDSELVNLPIFSNIHDALSQFYVPHWISLKNPNVYLYALIIAAVASLETLLNLEASEKLDKKKRYSSRNRELVAQGVGNILAGIFGGIPITSVIVRSSVNIQSGANSKLSTILHGFWFLIALILIPHWLNLIPLASLASILIYVGYKLTTPRIYKKMNKLGFSYYFPFYVTVIAIVFSNVLLGVIIGLICSIFFILKENSQMRLDIIKEKHPSGIIHRIILPQHLSFLKKATLVTELNSFPKKTRLIIDARYTKYIDNDIIELIKEFYQSIAPRKKITLNLIGFKKHYEIHDHIDIISVTTYDVQSELAPSDIIEILREGNFRFVKDQRINRFFPAEIKATASSQYPIAVVLSCIDSRVPVETVFDMGVGDLFSIRVAGNVVNEDILGSLEFACYIAKAKLIVVLGHTGCGAIKAACDHVDEGHITHLIEKILPSVQEETLANSQTKKPGYDEEEFRFRITKRNISNSVKTIYQSSKILKELIDNKKIGIISAIYDIKSGLVEFYTADINFEVKEYDDMNI